MEFKITPLVGVGPIKLGDRREMVRKNAEAYGLRLQMQSSEKNHDWFGDMLIQVEYTDETASFIGVHCQKGVGFMYMQKNVFELAAPEVFALIASNETSPHGYNEYEYCFPDQIMTVWNATEEYDCLGGYTRSVFAQVGVGDKRYLSDAWGIGS